MRPLVIVDDGLILSMLNDNGISGQIPCLTNRREMFRKPVGGCGSCARKKLERQRKELAGIKMCLGNLGPDKKQILKKYLDAEKVRVFYIDGAGKTVQITF